MSSIAYNKHNSFVVIHSNKKLLLDILKKNDKEKTCSLCNKKFEKTHELRHHILLECFTNEMAKNNEISKKNINITTDNSTNNNCHNTNNITDNSTNNITDNTTNTNNITNIIINLPPIEFDKNWSMEEIVEFKTKYDILYSDIMYTSLLQKLLENKKNLNVIVDTSKNVGFIYKNDAEKYVKMDIDDITENSMDKLHKNLLELNNNINPVTNYQSITKINEERINTKLKDYKNKPDLKKRVDFLIADIYDKKKVNAYDVSKTVDDLKY